MYILILPNNISQDFLRKILVIEIIYRILERKTMKVVDSDKLVII